MRTVIIFLLTFLAAMVTLTLLRLNGLLPMIPEGGDLWCYCMLAGGFGGSVYCLRAVYINASVRKNWDAAWLPWYYIRPFVSLVCGGISYLFLKAGLLVLEAGKKPDSTNLGFLALAFIAGLNVDKFVTKIEDLAQATWGIEKSRTAKEEIQNKP